MCNEDSFTLGFKFVLGGGYGPQYNSMMKEVVGDHMIHFLKNDKYTEGIEAGVNEVIHRVTKDVTFFEWNGT